MEIVFSHIDQYHLDVEWQVAVSNGRLAFAGGRPTAGQTQHTVPPHLPQRIPQALLPTGHLGTETIAYARVRYRTTGWSTFGVWHPPTRGHSLSIVV